MTYVTDIVSLIKHTDYKTASVSTMFQLKLLGKSNRCCTILPGFGDYSIGCDLMEQYVLKKPRTKKKKCMCWTFRLHVCETLKLLTGCLLPPETIRSLWIERAISV